MFPGLKIGSNLLCIFAIVHTFAFAGSSQHKSALLTDSAAVEQLRLKSLNLQSTMPDSALIYAQRGLNLSRKIGYKKGEGDCLNRLGVVFWRNGRYDRALSCLLKSLKLREEISDLLGELKSLNDIGIIYSDQGDNLKALSYHFKAKAVAELLHDKKRISIVLSNIGNCYFKLNKINLALNYALQAYAIQHALNDRASLPNTLSILGDINGKMGNTSLAFEYYRLSVSYAIANEDQGAIADTYNSMASLFNKVNLTDSCLYYASGALKAAQIAKYPEGIYTAGNLLTGYYHGKSENLELKYYKIAIAAKDSMFNAEKVKNIQALSFNEAVRQEEMAEEKYRQSEERIINLQLIGIVVFIVSFFFILLLISRSRVNRKVVEFMSVLSLLMFFEFITLLVHPFVQLISNHLPVIELLILVILAAILVPLHHKLTHWVHENLVHAKPRPKKTTTVDTATEIPGTIVS
jgi:tetratricopeptide (TPR) repeat protein